jgi:ribonuclease D
VTALPRWIRTSQDVAALAAHLARSPAIALDTEADSLHHYPERLCLVQVADATGAAHLVDPFSPADLSPLGAVLADPAVLKVVHAGDNDLAALKRRHGFAFASLFDTYIAARFLGGEALGLDALLERRIGIALGPSRQKDDWSVRPLTPEQEAYALDDVRHLIPLKDYLCDELRARGREAWALEECAALSQVVPAVKVEDPEVYLDLKGARNLAPRSLAVLRELHALREALARRADRPPFKILGNETLLELASARPRDAAQLATVRGCTPRVVGRWGEAILATITRAEAIPEDALPVVPRRPRPVMPAPVRRRIEALRAWRAVAAGRLGLDAGLLLPGRLIERIAAEAPTDLASLERVEGIRRWRVGEVGAEIVVAITTGQDRAGPR